MDHILFINACVRPESRTRDLARTPRRTQRRRGERPRYCLTTISSNGRNSREPLRRSGSRFF